MLWLFSWITIVRWYPWSMGVNHSFKEKKHRKERAMKYKVTKGSQKRKPKQTKFILFFLSHLSWANNYLQSRRFKEKRECIPISQLAILFSWS